MIIKKFKSNLLREEKPKRMFPFKNRKFLLVFQFKELFVLFKSVHFTPFQNQGGWHLKADKDAEISLHNVIIKMNVEFNTVVNPIFMFLIFFDKCVRYICSLKQPLAGCQIFGIPTFKGKCKGG